jgi:uncharacterized membrane protein YdcZ (DUF606 family)
MNGLALLTVLVAVGSTEASRMVKGQKPTMSPVIGGFVLGIFLFSFMSIHPALGSKFCYLIIVSALLINGGDLAKALYPRKTNPALLQAARQRKGAVSI